LDRFWRWRSGTAPGFRIGESGRIEVDRPESECRIEFAKHFAEFVLNLARSVERTGTGSSTGVGFDQHEFAFAENEGRISGVALDQGFPSRHGEVVVEAHPQPFATHIRDPVEVEQTFLIGDEHGRSDESHAFVLADRG
jgi:hypothetical protein